MVHVNNSIANKNNIIMRITFKLDKTVQVFRLGKTENKKISDGKDKIVQSYTFSEDQYNYIRQNMLAGTKPVFKEFFSLDAKNCFDCPFSVNSNAGGKCYTHKVMQYLGFVAMLKSIVNEFGNIKNIPTYDNGFALQLGAMAKDRYVRFGSYGEPTMHPITLVGLMASMAKTYTGYTHQWFRKPEYLKFFMASTHNEFQAKTVKDKFESRSFIAVKDNKGVDAVICPASDEAGFKSTCAACGLCSGSMGKGKKNVVILEH